MTKPDQVSADQVLAKQSQDAPDATIEHVRELLFGGKQREIEQVTSAHQAQLQQIEQLMETNVSELRAELARIENNFQQRQDESVQTIAKAIDQFGDSVKSLLAK